MTVEQTTTSLDWPEVDILPTDAERATLVGRAFLPDPVAGPAVVTVCDGVLFDITRDIPTIGHLLSESGAAERVRRAQGPEIGALSDIAANTPSAERPHLLAPVDVQAIKACGVTFASSMPAAAQQQPRGLVSVGRGGAEPGEGAGQADLPLDRLLGLPLVPRDGA